MFPPYPLYTHTLLLAGIGTFVVWHRVDERRADHDVMKREKRADGTEDRRRNGRRRLPCVAFVEVPAMAIRQNILNLFSCLPSVQFSSVQIIKSSSMQRACTCRGIGVQRFRRRRALVKTRTALDQQHPGDWRTAPGALFPHQYSASCLLLSDVTVFSSNHKLLAQRQQRSSRDSQNICSRRVFFFSTVTTPLEDPDQEADAAVFPAEAATSSVVNIVHTTRSTSLSTATSTATTTRHRPRLEALRQQLSLEKAKPESATTTATGKQPHSSPGMPGVSKRTDTVASSSSRSESAAAPMDLRALAARIQLPKHDDSVLTDRFQRLHSYLRLSLTERCNLRCTYCMPAAGVPLQPPSHLLTTAELLQLAQYFAHWGVTKFRLTGGEPTLRRDLVDICHGLSEILQQQAMTRQEETTPTKIGMTTNGIVLAKMLPDLVAAGLGSVNISLDTLDGAKFEKLTRRPASYLSRVWQALETASALLDNDHATTSSPNVKLNCVVMRGINDDEVADFVALTEQFPKLAVRFIEYMPFTENGWNAQALVPATELRRRLLEDHGVALAPLPVTDRHDTTVWYRTEQNEQAQVGFITSMSNQFCAGCNRLRLSADGHMQVCLFENNTTNNGMISLRDALRQGLSAEEISKLVFAALQRKQWALGGHATPQAISDHAAVHKNKPMTLIGG